MKKISLRKWKKFQTSRQFKIHSPPSYVAEVDDDNDFSSSDESEEKNEDKADASTHRDEEK